MRVRDARPADWREVAALLAELGRPEVLGTDQEAASRGLYERYLGRHDTGAFVAEDDDGTVIGFIDVEVRTRLNFAEPEAWVPDLIVRESARGRGAGAALLDRAEQLGRERGCFSISLESATWRERAHAFYEREGWTRSAFAFTKTLSDRPWPPPPPGEPGSAPR